MCCFIRTYLRFAAGTQRESSYWYKKIQDIIADILQDPLLKDHIDWHPKPLFGKDGKRVFGPFSSGMFWEEKQFQYKGKTVIVFIVYSDATDFYSGVSAHPVFSKKLDKFGIHTVYLLYKLTTLLFCSYSGEYQGITQVYKCGMETSDAASSAQSLFDGNEEEASTGGESQNLAQGDGPCISRLQRAPGERNASQV